MWRTLFDEVRARLLLWAGLALGFLAGYHLLLLGLMVARFGHGPRRTSGSGRWARLYRGSARRNWGLS